MRSTDAARSLSEDLADAESAVDSALARAAGLTRRLAEARRGLPSPPDRLDPALRRVSDAMTALGEAQRELGRAMVELNEAAIDSLAAADRKVG